MAVKSYADKIKFSKPFNAEASIVFYTPAVRWLDELLKHHGAEARKRVLENLTQEQFDNINSRLWGLSD